MPFTIKGEGPITPRVCTIAAVVVGKVSGRGIENTRQSEHDFANSNIDTLNKLKIMNACSRGQKKDIEKLITIPLNAYPLKKDINDYII